MSGSVLMVQSLLRILSLSLSLSAPPQLSLSKKQNKQQQQQKTILDQGRLLPEALPDHPGSQRPLCAMKVHSSSCLAPSRSIREPSYEARTVLGTSTPAGGLVEAEGTGRMCRRRGGNMSSGRQPPTSPRGPAGHFPTFFSPLQLRLTGNNNNNHIKNSNSNGNNVYHSSSPSC